LVAMKNNWRLRRSKISFEASKKEGNILERCLSSG
jgi:hypothetical protein